MQLRFAFPLASLLVAGATLAQSATIAPNDPGIVWSGAMTASIDATRASFSRPGTAALYTVQMTPGVRASFRTDATQVEVTVDYVSIAILPEFSVEVDGVPQPKIGMGTLGAQTLVVTTQPTPVPRVVTIVWPVGADVDLLSIGLTGGSQQLLPCSRHRRVNASSASGTRSPRACSPASRTTRFRPGWRGRGVGP